MGNVVVILQFFRGKFISFVCNLAGFAHCGCIVGPQWKLVELYSTVTLFFIWHKLVLGYISVIELSRLFLECCWLPCESFVDYYPVKVSSFFFRRWSPKVGPFKWKISRSSSQRCRLLSIMFQTEFLSFCSYLSEIWCFFEKCFFNMAISIEKARLYNAVSDILSGVSWRERNSSLCKIKSLRFNSWQLIYGTNQFAVPHFFICLFTDL